MGTTVKGKEQVIKRYFNSWIVPNFKILRILSVKMLAIVNVIVQFIGIKLKL